MGRLVHCDGPTAMLRDALLRNRAADDHSIVDWLYGYDFPDPMMPDRAYAQCRRTHQRRVA